MRSKSVTLNTREAQIMQEHNMHTFMSCLWAVLEIIKYQYQVWCDAVFQSSVSPMHFYADSVAQIE